MVYSLFHSLLYEIAYQKQIAALQKATKTFQGTPSFSFQGTGFFSTAKVEGKHWLIDPEGNLFLTIGVNDVDLHGSKKQNGVSPYAEAVKKQGLSKEQWIQRTQKRLLQLLSFLFQDQSGPYSF